MKKFIPIALIAIMLLSSTVVFTNCNREPSSAVNQDKIWTSYKILYNANSDKTTVRAVFRFSNAFGTLLELEAPAEVKFNNDVLSFVNAFAYYEKEYAGQISTGTFTYTDLDGNTFTNTFYVADTIAFPANLDTISQGAAYNLVWVGDSLRTNEAVTVTIDGINQQDAQIFVTNTIHANNIVLGMNKLQLLGVGSSTAYMFREFRPTIQEASSAGGELVGRYTATNKTIEIIP